MAAAISLVVLLVLDTVVPRSTNLDATSIAGITIGVSIAADDTVTLEESYDLRLRSPEGGTSPRFVRSVEVPKGLAPSFACTGEHNGTPFVTEVRPFDSTYLWLPQTYSQDVDGPISRFSFSCTAKGLVQRDGHERKLTFPLIDRRYTLPAEALTARLYFLFPPREDPVGVPRVRAEIIPAEGSPTPAAIVQERPNVFVLNIRDPLEIGTDARLIVTWRPPGPLT